MKFKDLIPGIRNFDPSEALKKKPVLIEVYFLKIILVLQTHLNTLEAIFIGIGL